VTAAVMTSREAEYAALRVDEERLHLRLVLSTLAEEYRTGTVPKERFQQLRDELDRVRADLEALR
jgi:hypothetical protein